MGILSIELDQTMSNKVNIFVCRNHIPEIKAAVEAEEFDDVTIAELPDVCNNSSHLSSNEIAEFIKKKPDESDCIGVFCSGCKFIEIIQNRCFIVSHTIGFELFASQSLISDYLNKGGYIITSGILSRWRENLEEIGLNREIAKDLYGNSVKNIVWFDTGINKAESEKEIKHFSEFSGLPYQRVPLGLDYTRLLLTKIILQWRLRKRKSDITKKIENCDRRIADYAMALDLMGSISGVTTEVDVIENIMKLFNAICAPKFLIYLPYVDYKFGTPRSCPSGKSIDLELFSDITEMVSEYKWIDSGNGFIIKIRRNNDLLGAFAMNDFAFPIYKDYYLNFALSMINVISLAVMNARIYEQLSDTRKDLLAANRELEAFSYSVAHDLKAPLQIIAGFTDIMKDDFGEILGETGNDYLERILLSAKRMFQLIDDLLRLAKTGVQEVVKSDVNLSIIVNGIVDNLKNKVPQRKVEFRIEQNITVNADDKLIRIALENLLGNAWKFSAKRDAAYIEFGQFLQQEGKRVFFIKDNGAGFNAEMAGRLFEPFQRLHSGKEYQGTGIGLSIVKRIVQRHGGKIWAEGEPDKGATFYFTLK